MKIEDAEDETHEKAKRGSMSMEVAAEIAARYGAVIPPGLTVKVIPRGVSGIPELGQGEHWRVAIKRQNERAKASRALARRLAEADKAASQVADDAADRAQMFADIAVKVAKAKPQKAKSTGNPGLQSPEVRKRAIEAHRAAAERTAAAQAAKIAALITEGLNAAQAAERMGLAERSVRNAAKRHGLRFTKAAVIEDGKAFEDGRAADRYRRKRDAAARAQAMIARRDAGATTAELAVEFDTSEKRVRQILWDYGVGQATRTMAKDADMAAAVRAAFDEGLSQHQTAAKLGIGATTVFRLQKRLGLNAAEKRNRVTVKYAKSPEKLAQAERCADMFRAGKSDREIGLALGISKAAAQRARSALGVYGAAPAETETHRAIKVQRAAGFSVRAIANALGVSKSTVSRIASREHEDAA